MRAIGFAADSDPDALLEAGAELLYSLVNLPATLGLPWATHYLLARAQRVV